MKRIVLVAAIAIFSAAAHAETYGDGTNRVTIPEGCTSYSCMSVSIPGHYSHNVKPEKSRKPRKSASKLQDQAKQDHDKQPDQPKQ